MAKGLKNKSDDDESVDSDSGDFEDDEALDDDESESSSDDYEEW